MQQETFHRRSLPHWSSDVLGGLLLAAGWILTLLSILLITGPVLEHLGDPEGRWHAVHPNQPFTLKARLQLRRRTLYTPAVQTFERFGFVVRAVVWGLMHLRRLLADPRPAAVGRLDGILISHLHFDHFDPGTLKRFDRRIKVVVPRGGAVRYLERKGFRDVRGAEPDTAVQLGPVRVRAVPARHSGSRGTPG
jgi:hypothetical protein